MKRSGFSMLELVVVMLIMGTLAGIAISKMGGSDTGAIKASMRSDIRGAIATINACYRDKLNYDSCTLAKDGTVTGTGLTSIDSGNIYKIGVSPNNTLTFTAAGTGSTMPELSVSNSTYTGSTFTYTNDTASITEVPSTSTSTSN